MRERQKKSDGKPQAAVNQEKLKYLNKYYQHLSYRELNP